MDMLQRLNIKRIISDKDIGISICRIVYSVLTGILIAASAINHGIFAWVAFIPIFIALNNSSLKEAVLLGALAGASAASLLFYGVIPYDFFYLALLIIYSMLQGALSAAFYIILFKKTKGISNIFLPPSVWIFFEYLKTISLLSFPASLGATQYGFTSLIQIVSITGVYGISLLILWVNRIISIWIIEILAYVNIGRLNTEKVKNALSASLVLSLSFTIIIIWGNNVLKKNPAAQTGIKISVLQGNIPIESYLKQAQNPNIRNMISRRYFRMTEKALNNEKPDIVVWPEGATPERIMNLSSYKDKIINYAKLYNVNFIIGSPGTDKHGYNTNSAYVVSNKGETVVQYDKIRIVPFLEKFKKGENYSPVNTNLGRMGLLICFESLYPQAARQLAAQGAEALFILTNDCGLINSPSLVSMYANDSVMRAVENRRYVVRADQSGSSLIIDPFGRVLNSYSGRVKYIMNGIINIRKNKTFYTLFGDYLPFLPLLLGSIVILKK